jgi:hypothetical protein
LLLCIASFLRPFGSCTLFNQRRGGVIDKLHQVQLNHLVIWWTHEYPKLQGSSMPQLWSFRKSSVFKYQGPFSCILE